MTKKAAAHINENTRRKGSNLDSRYGEIGIPAVAAALRYQSELRNSTQEPVEHRQDDRVAEPVA